MKRVTRGQPLGRGKQTKHSLSSVIEVQKILGGGIFLTRVYSENPAQLHAKDLLRSAAHAKSCYYYFSSGCCAHAEESVDPHSFSALSPPRTIFLAALFPSARRARFLIPRERQLTLSAESRTPNRLSNFKLTVLLITESHINMLFTLLYWCSLNINNIFWAVQWKLNQIKDAQFG